MHSIYIVDWNKWKIVLKIIFIANFIQLKNILS